MGDHSHSDADGSQQEPTIRSASGPPASGSVSEEVLQLLLLGAQSRGQFDTDARTAIRHVSRELRTNGEPPEKLLIAFKDEVCKAIILAGLPAGPERNRLLEHVVAVFIEELFPSAGLNDDPLLPDGQSTPTGW